MKRFALVLAFAASMLAADHPVVSRAAMETVERNVDMSIRTLDITEQYDLLGFTRGLYLPGYGVVITAEVNLVITPITPFTRAPVGPQLVRLRQKKAQRLVAVRELMRKTLVDTAATLDPVPGPEHIVFGMTLFYREFEEREGLPSQIIMQASKRTLVDFKANRINRAQLEAAIQVHEL